VDYIGYRGLDFQNPEFGDGAAVKGRGSKEDTRRFYNNFNQLLSYRNSFGNHNLNFLVGHESYFLKRNYMYAERTTFILPGLYELAAAATATESTSVEDNYKTEGFLGRAEYNYNDRYYLSASFRRDGSSRFSKDNRWGNFYSVGASWRISQENFMQSAGAVNLLKIKASYGTKGNDGTDTYYAYQGLYNTGYNNNTAPGLVAGTLPSPYLKWESKNSLNVGLELGLFNRINIDLNYFNDYSADLLFLLPLPMSTGYKSRWDNVGDMKNTGVELDLNSVILKADNFSWNFNLNFTHFKNEITKLPQEQIPQGIQQLEVGHSRYEYYTRDFAGVDPATGASLWYYDEVVTDGNGAPVPGPDGKPQKTGKRLTTNNYSKADRYYVGNSLPDFYGGFTNTFQAYGFDLSVFFAYSVGGKIFDSNYQSLMHGGAFGDAWHKDILNRWTPDNKNTSIPALKASDTNINQSSSRFLIDGSYLVLRNVTFGYSIPNNITNKLHINNVRAFVSGDNLISLTKRKGLDPSSNISGITGFDYVPVQTISFGINASF
jgi:TonB-linked SusC/RagA family outer membrane protein